MNTYLYSYGSGPWGASTTRRTREYILAQPQFAKVHPVLMDRLFDLCDATITVGGDYGFGGGWRSSVQQRNLFVSRYTKHPTAPGVWWDGSPSWPEDKGWWRHTSGAPSAPPGRSYHESTTNNGLGLALAVDMVGDHSKANPMAAKFGLRHFGNINGEPWHYQPVEIPNARRNYGGEFEELPPPPTPIEEVPQMQAIAPVRLMDTRPLDGAFLPADTVVKVSAPGRPDWARSVVVNITATNTAGPGYLTVWPGGARPDTSNLNFVGGQTIANLAVVALAGDGTFSVSPVKAGCDIIVDQQGWAA